MVPKFDRDMLILWVNLFFLPGMVVELRVLSARGGGTVSGYFDWDHREDFIRAAIEWSGRAPAVYCTLNPVDPVILARSLNRVKRYAKVTTKDDEILGRLWLLIDFDPKRRPEISSTDAEHEAAIALARQCREYLRSQGLPDSILADSGNGAHLLYRIDLPNDQESTHLIKRILESLASRFSNSAVGLDRKVYNAARIWKLYGTLAAKGDHTPDRPHRIARILEAPEALEVVPIDLLKGLLPQVQTSPSPRKADENQAFEAVTTTGSRGLFDLESWIVEHNVPVVEDKPWQDGRLWVVNPCPWNPTHTNRSAFVGIRANGAIFAGCHHDSCIDKGWHDLRDIYEPGWRDKEANFKPQESIKDPHRNARNFLETECKHPDGPILRYHYGAWYWWDGASYHVVPVKEINARVTSSVKDAFDRESIEAQKRGDTEGMVALPVTTAVVRNVLGALESLVLIPSTFDPPCWIGNGRLWEPCDVLPAINGLYYLPLLLDGIDKHIKPTPLFFSTFALDYEIRLDAPPPLAWLKFLDEIWGKDSQCIETLQEFMGYCLTPGTSQQKILSLIGPKRSGKSVIGRVTTGVIGQQNVAGTTLSDLGERFGLEPLMGRNLAIIPDARLRGQSPKVVERLLSISGQDMLLVDRKGYAAISVVLPTRLMILSNELPRFDDASGAVVSRMILLQTIQSFYGREDILLPERLLKERASILLWALEGLKRLRERGYFVQPDSGKQLIDEWENLSSPVRVFVKERCDLGPFKRVGVADLYNAYVEWCREVGLIHPEAPNTFGRNLRAVVPHLGVIQPREGEGRVRIYDGIRLVSP